MSGAPGTPPAAATAAGSPEKAPPPGPPSPWKRRLTVAGLHALALVLFLAYFMAARPHQIDARVNVENALDAMKKQLLASEDQRGALESNFKTYRQQTELAVALLAAAFVLELGATVAGGIWGFMDARRSTGGA